MIYRKPCPPDTPFVPMPYTFLAPARIRLRRPDGLTVLMGYGIGDIVDVLQPEVQFCIVCQDRLLEIPLADGSFMIDVPDDIQVRRTYL